MKPLAVPAFMLILFLFSSCRKDHNNNEQPQKKPAVEFISMKVDGGFFVDSLTTKSFFQRSSAANSLLEIEGIDTARGKDWAKVRLYVRINLGGHEIKKGVYDKVASGIDNSIDWQTYADEIVLKDGYRASGSNQRHPDAPFRIEITRVDDIFVEGTFYGRAYGIKGEKEVTEGKFKIAKEKIEKLN
ncbi:hypothetical protein [Chitinophaga qingshengii]|uniref:Lipoprotein n=1 Tax=Chitinophaga qingshengii TaxID=1569794 RepID=A0ABR7THQ9_9BACT|nr:hypothetical protein [Chitinophaga qingshengii]MBC9930046.1 hypothetical protein [Chitinophaga qingshengii]